MAGSHSFPTPASCREEHRPHESGASARAEDQRAGRHPRPRPARPQDRPVAPQPAHRRRGRRGRVIAVTGYFIWKGQKEGRSALWEKFDATEGTLDNAANGDEVQAALDKFKDLADQNPRTLPGGAAQFDRARALLHRGLERLYSSDRDEALADVKEAHDSTPSSPPTPSSATLTRCSARRRMMGVAKADESLGDLEKARDGYKNVAKTYPKGVLTKAAEERAKYLDDADNRNRIKALYDKLDEQAKSQTDADGKSRQEVGVGPVDGGWWMAVKGSRYPPSTIHHRSHPPCPTLSPLPQSTAKRPSS